VLELLGVTPVLLGQCPGVSLLVFVGRFDPLCLQGFRENDGFGLATGVSHAVDLLTGDHFEGGAGERASGTPGFDQGVVDVPENEARAARGICHPSSVPPGPVPFRWTG
jgi:hypothetical protein